MTAEATRVLEAIAWTEKTRARSACLPLMRIATLVLGDASAAAALLRRLRALGCVRASAQILQHGWLTEKGRSWVRMTTFRCRRPAETGLA